MRAMQPDDFDYTLPEHLIARYPTDQRSSARLLVVGQQDHRKHEDRVVSDLPELLQAGDLLVVNNTRVIPARLFGRRRTGAKIEILLERQLAEDLATAQLRANRKPKVGEPFAIVDTNDEAVANASLVEREGRFFQLRFDRSIAVITERAGHIPLPPYIDRQDEALDAERYQTVYAKTPGAVAAPTAGLHFDQLLLDALKSRGIERAAVTLHVAAGTFQPLDDRQLERGKLHQEWFSVPASVVEAVRSTRARNGRVVAVGTTAMRALESAALSGTLQPTEGDTDLFIRPGFEFQVVDVLMTNFHLPRSSLMMLVGAFAGTERILSAYRHALAHDYRFFSYGDAMLLTRASGAP
ncbi:MAG: tRNA preQ1(34) S-adenosylmethionine ribosyltransferase-isomerase QueA [Pseudomonadota bacterium]